MAIKKEFCFELANGTKLYRTFSDAGKQILQNETGVIFEDAVDVEGAIFSYSETETNVPGGNDEQG
nr:MAG TPA: hypothetical protein [Caudoviricetes sp.]